MNGSEPVSIDSEAMEAWFDPDKHQLYVDHPVTVSRGALVTVRGQVRRVREVAYWNGAGTVADLDPGPVYFPDAAVITRHTFGDRDPSTGERPEVVTPLWDGPVLVEVEASAEAAQSELLDRRRDLVLYTVKLPLEVADLKQDDQIKITVSRDPRLINRVLHVIRVVSASHAQERVVMAAERQV